MLYDFLQLNREKQDPLWEQLYQGLRQAIETGRLIPGEKLASIRQASGELSVSRTTIENAYARLCMEGYAESRPQSGYRVRTVLPHHVAAKISRAAEPRYDFGTTSIDSEAADLQNWKKLVRAVLADSKAVTAYGNPQGEQELREQLASYAFRARGVIAEPENIFIGAGVGPLLQLLCPLFPEKPVVVMESPGFVQAEQIFCDYGFSITVPHVIGGEDGVWNLPDGENSLAVELPSLRPKSGSSAFSSRRSMLSAWVAERSGRYVLEDDYNGELRYKTRPVPAFQGSCPEKTVFLGSFSKLLVPSVRIAYMVLPPQLAEAARSRLATLNQTAGKTEQLALAEYIRSGLMEKHLRRLRRLYGKKSQILSAAIGETFGKRAACTLYETYLSFVFTPSALCSGEELSDLALKAGIICRPAPGFFGDRPQMVLGFSGISADQIKEGIHALGEAWDGVF